MYRIEIQCGVLALQHIGSPLTVSGMVHEEVTYPVHALQDDLPSTMESWDIDSTMIHDFDMLGIGDQETETLEETTMDSESNSQVMTGEYNNLPNVAEPSGMREIDHINTFGPMVKSVDLMDILVKHGETTQKASASTGALGNRSREGERTEGACNWLRRCSH